MIVTRHAIKRLKKYKLVPKSTSGDSAKRYIKKMVRNETRVVKKDRKTGALYKINPYFTAVMFGSRVVTLYPSNLPEELIEKEPEDQYEMRKIQRVQK